MTREDVPQLLMGVIENFHAENLPKHQAPNLFKILAGACCKVITQDIVLESCRFTITWVQMFSAEIATSLFPGRWLGWWSRRSWISLWHRLRQTGSERGHECLTGHEVPCVDVELGRQSHKAHKAISQKHLWEVFP